MGVLVFILVLVALILVHELGHFAAAKWSGMRVDEFGIGYPPRAWGVRRGETDYTLNWLPFGGFVKIYGEDGDGGEPGERSFSSKPKWRQALVLLAGIAMNLLFAYVLLTVTLAVGMPRALTSEEAARAKDAALIVSDVKPGSPAERAGIARGDTVKSASDGASVFSGADGAAFTAFVSESDGAPIDLALERDGKERILRATPEAGVVESDPGRVALGIAIAPYGTVPVPLLEAPVQGALLTWEATKETAAGLAGFFGSVFTLSANLSQVSGPVGIAGAVEDASKSGIVPLLTLTALISINLALINFIPIPALDGGRLLFVLIEAVTRRPIPSATANAVNAIGFGLLVLLMLAVTASDVFKLLG